MTTTEKPTHAPCCSSHGVDMDCAKYRRTHFVKVGNCCDAWARQHPTMPIPDEAAEAFRRVKTEWACEPLASDHYALEAAAPLIVAADYEQFADELRGTLHNLPEYTHGSLAWTVMNVIDQRIEDLRGGAQ